MKHILWKWKLWIVVLVFLGISVVYATRPAYYPSGESEGAGQGHVLMSSQIAWNVLDTTSSDGTEPTALAVTERTYATVVAAIAAASSGDEEISHAHIPATWNKLRFRCIGITDGGLIKHQIYLGTLAGGTDCEFSRAGQLEWTIGTQASTTSTYEMADTVTATAADWVLAWSQKSPVSNQVAEAAIDIMGADHIVIVTYSANCDSKLLVKGY